MIYIFHGENTYESWKEYQKTFADLNKKIDSVTILDMDEVERVTDVNFGVVDMFSKTKIYILKRFFQSKKDVLDKLTLNIQTDKDNQFIIWEDKKIDGRLKSYKDLKKISVEREFKNLSVIKLSKWIQAKAKLLKLELDKKSLDEIQFRYKSNQWVIENELLKLKNLGRKIESSNLEEYISEGIEGEIWYFVENFMKRNRKALASYLQNSKSIGDNVFGILSALGNNLRNLIVLKEYNNRDSSLQSLKVHPFVIKKLKTNNGNFSLDRLKKILDSIINIDKALKSGETQPKLALTLLSTLV